MLHSSSTSQTHRFSNRSRPHCLHLTTSWPSLRAALGSCGASCWSPPANNMLGTGKRGGYITSHIFAATSLNCPRAMNLIVQRPTPPQPALRTLSTASHLLVRAANLNSARPQYGLFRAFGFAATAFISLDDPWKSSALPTPANMALTTFGAVLFVRP